MKSAILRQCPSGMKSDDFQRLWIDQKTSRAAILSLILDQYNSCDRITEDDFKQGDACGLIAFKAGKRAALSLLIDILKDAD